MGGLPAAKADDRTKNIPIVILTARDELQGRRRAE